MRNGSPNNTHNHGPLATHIQRPNSTDAQGRPVSYCAKASGRFASPDAAECLTCQKAYRAPRTPMPEWEAVPEAPREPPPRTPRQQFAPRGSVWQPPAGPLREPTPRLRFDARAIDAPPDAVPFAPPPRPPESAPERDAPPLAPRSRPATPPRVGRARPPEPPAAAAPAAPRVPPSVWNKRLPAFTPTGPRCADGSYRHRRRVSFRDGRLLGECRLCGDTIDYDAKEPADAAR